MNTMIDNFNKSVGILYSKGKKGEINVWSVQTDGPEIIVRHGRLLGKIQKSVKLAKGKNIGRANETTPAVQAVMQAKAMYRKQMDKGYFKTIEEAENTLVFLPMLAHPYPKYKHKVLYPCSVQPKFDGVRCLSYWENGDIKLLSRGGKNYNIEHIKQGVRQHLPKTKVFDGEIYVHNMPLQEINSLVKRPQEESLLLEYHIYDMFSVDNLEELWSSRLMELKKVWSGFSNMGSLKEVSTVDVNSEEEVFEIEKDLVADNYEGCIIRGEGPYLLAKRSSMLLKVKSFLDDEFEVIGFLEDVRGGVRFICRTSEGKEFKVVPVGTLEQRREYLIRGNEYVGKMLKVKYVNFTPDGIPFHPVGLCFRLEEDM